ncbi:L-threonylcarbamoyladenylate synthase [Acidicapsa dinghuensis]|uniref:Threonylcarbamoyl-AMP synthase n=1 Tax=Acidicapsa dinghuensis TaxID=2218256 RepID=A0ABW1EM17_9BACT|nr:L-threonylcarbamoyladenylate synthase [Acidicapsa dinghuensis]
MQTQRLRVDPDHLDLPESIKALNCAAGILRNGGTVALPTETVYGLGANALNDNAVARIFSAKQRPSWDPLIVHISSKAMLDTVTLPRSQTAQALIDTFWPGPLTLLVPRTAAVPDAVTAGRPLVGVRMPAHSVARELIRRAGVPIAAPSANRFGHVSPTTADHVLADLDGRIDAVIDAGPTKVGLESTVLDTTTLPMLIYRPGAVTLAQIRAVVGQAELYRESKLTSRHTPEALPSPGVGLRHYAPRARLILVELSGCEERWNTRCARALLAYSSSFPGQRIGVLMPDASGLTLVPPAELEIFPWGNWEQLDTLAQRLFAGLRALDAAGCDVILCPLPPASGVGLALRDRLHKAAVSTDAE